MSGDKCIGGMNFDFREVSQVKLRTKSVLFLKLGPQIGCLFLQKEAEKEMPCLLPRLWFPKADNLEVHGVSQPKTVAGSLAGPVKSSRTFSQKP